MATPRRRLVRAAPAAEVPAASHQGRLQKLRQGLEKERAALARWMAKLRRAFHAVEKGQASLARLERRLAREEG